MKRVRLTIQHNPKDAAEDLFWVARLRHDLWANSPVEIDPDNWANRTYRDSDENAYFDLVTDMVPEVEQVLAKQDYKNRVRLHILEEGVGESCQNCGKTSGVVFPTICPHCGHRDISPCPYCQTEVPRQEYKKIEGDLFHCSQCHRRVRLQINPDLWMADGSLSEPVILVEKTQDNGNGNHV